MLSVVYSCKSRTFSFSAYTRIDFPIVMRRVVQKIPAFHEPFQPRGRVYYGSAGKAIFPELQSIGSTSERLLMRDMQATFT